MPSGAERRTSLPFLALVAGTFVFGWVSGFLVLLKAWQLAHVPRWLMFSGVGYVTFMVLPALTGVAVTRLCARLVTRGWGGAPLRLCAAGACCLLAGVLVL